MCCDGTSTKYVTVVLRHSLLGILMVFLTSVTASAQEMMEASVQVVQIAGRQIYLELQDPLDTPDLLAADMVMQLYREGDMVGEVKIIAVTAPRVVASFIESSFALTRGEFLIGRWKSIGIPPPPADETDAQKGELSDSTIVESEPVSIFDVEPTRVRTARATDRFDVNGRVMFTSNVNNSITKWSRVLDNRDIRWSSLPSTSISFRVRDRESNWSAQVQARYSHRWQTDSRINNTGLLSLYNVYVSKGFDSLPLTVQFGRFYNRYQNESPYWDGVLVSYDQRPIRIGLLGGFNPSRSNEGVQFDYPKTGVFITHQTRGKTLRSYSQFNATAEFPTQFSQRTVLTWEQRFDYTFLSVDGEYQIEKVEGLKEWQQSRLQLRADAEITPWLNIDVRYSSRSPLILRTSPAIFLDPRTRFGVDGTIKIQKIRFTTGFSTLNNDNRRSITYSSRVSYSDSPLWNLSWSAYGSYWDSEQGYSWNTGITSTKDFNTGLISVGLSGYQSRFLRTEQFTGSLYLNGSKSLKNGFTLSGRLNGSYGQLMIRNGLTFSVTKRF